MTYCDYDFYTKEYMGNVIAEADFPRLIKRAYDKLNALTFFRVEIIYEDIEQVDSKVLYKVKEALCSIAEVINNIDMAEKTYRENGGQVVSSVSSGSESISYATNNLVGVVLTDKKAQNQLFYDSAREYLAGTGLLYAGI